MALEIIKVCGITHPADAVAAVQAGATAIGMVFYAPSPRAVKTHEAAVIAAVVPPTALKVGVFVNEEPDRIRALAEAARLDVVQLHGDEGPETVAALSGLRLWRAFRVGPQFEPAVLDELQGVEAFLLDGPAGDAYGGAGVPFAWEKAIEAARYGKIIVAGGLDGSNVAEAIRISGPWGVDSSSKLERKPGEKDPAKVAAYVSAARQAG
ncbi:MAG: phosphoribosylanthranilate isomerase [Acidobacteria bacterium]|nr:phosphoribosylanthranilate isomerase [Acidobacteriota bacterium]